VRGRWRAGNASNGALGVSGEPEGVPLKRRAFVDGI